MAAVGLPKGGPPDGGGPRGGLAGGYVEGKGWFTGGGADPGERCIFMSCGITEVMEMYCVTKPQRPNCKHYSMKSLAPIAKTPK